MFQLLSSSIYVEYILKHWHHSLIVKIMTNSKFQKISYLILMSFATNIISNPVTGTIEEFFLESNQSYERRVQVYYPFSKEIDKDTKFIIMNDGEELFDGADSYNDKAWNIDKSFLNMKERGYQGNNIVIIAIDSAKRVDSQIFNETRRYAEYFPNETIEFLEGGIKKRLYRSHIGKKEQNHPSFIVKKLIPFLENKFQSNLNKTNMGIMGASMGSLSAINTVIENPGLFGFVGCISTHWIGINPSAYFLRFFNLGNSKTFGDEDITESIIKYIEKNADKLKDTKIYFDHGSLGLDTFYPEPQKRVNKTLDAKGIKYKYQVFQGHSHDAKYFGQRYGDILAYLVDSE